MKTVYWSFSLGDTLDQTLPTDYTDPPEKFAKDYKHRDQKLVKKMIKEDIN